MAVSCETSGGIDEHPPGTKPGPCSGREQPINLPRASRLTLSVLWFGLNFQTAALFALVLPLQIVLFVAPGQQVGSAQEAVLLAWLSVLGGLVSLFLPPLVGALSDRTVGTLGRRRPYVLLGTLIELVGTWVLATPGNLGFLLAGLLIFESRQQCVYRRVPGDAAGSGAGDAAWRSIGICGPDDDSGQCRQFWPGGGASGVD